MAHFSAPACRAAAPQTACHFRESSRPGTARRRDFCAGRLVRSSLEEEFKKQCLGMSNGTNSSSSSSSQERLKDLSASASQRLGGGGDLAAGPAAPASSSSSSSSSSAAAGSSSLPPAPEQPGFADSESAGAPFPAHLPPSEEPYHPLEFYPTSQMNLDWGNTAGPREAWVPSLSGGERRFRCYVILFGVGRVETEGIYSLRAVGKEDGLPTDTIVAFEHEDDALRYCTLLEASMDHDPTVWPIEWGELLEFCNNAGYRCRLEPAGSLLIPPDYNVGLTDWEKSLKLRKGEFSVLGAEPAPRSGGGPGEPPMAPAAPGGIFLDGWAWDAAAAAGFMDADELAVERLSAAIDSQLSSPEALEAVRARLERLLPRD